MQELTPHDVWTWLAVYTDGQQFAEYDDAGQERGFAEVDLSRVASIVLLPRVEGYPSHALHIDPTYQRPIFFRRRRLNLDLDGAVASLGMTATALGWQMTHQGRNVKAIVFYFDDGSSLFTHDPDMV